MSTRSGRLTGVSMPRKYRTGRRQTYRSSSCRSATLSDRMPPPTGVVSGPLMPTRYLRNVSSVSSGSQFPDCLNDFSPASTSRHAIRRRPAYAFSTAASKTRTLARQMSGPVPSPSMNGMMGWSGTFSPSCFRVIASPPIAIVSPSLVRSQSRIAFRSRPFHGVTSSSQKLWKSVWKSAAGQRYFRDFSQRAAVCTNMVLLRHSLPTDRTAHYIRLRRYAASAGRVRAPLSASAGQVRAPSAPPAAKTTSHAEVRVLAPPSRSAKALAEAQAKACVKICRACSFSPRAGTFNPFCSSRRRHPRPLPVDASSR